MIEEEIVQEVVENTTGEVIADVVGGVTDIVTPPTPEGIIVDLIIQGIIDWISGEVGEGQEVEYLPVEPKSRPFLTTSINDYSVIEGLLLIIVCLSSITTFLVIRTNRFLKRGKR